MKLHAQKIIGALAILIAAALAPSAKADLVQTVDVNPDPNIFECYITAIERDVTIDGSTVHALVYKDESGAVPPASAGIPILVMNLKVGEKVICHFVNQLSTESAGIHWHGIELDNDSDGTPSLKTQCFRAKATPISSTRSVRASSGFIRTCCRATHSSAGCTA